MLWGRFSWAAIKALLFSNQLSLKSEMPRRSMLALQSAG